MVEFIPSALPLWINPWRWIYFILFFIFLPEGKESAWHIASIFLQTHHQFPDYNYVHLKMPKA